MIRKTILFILSLGTIGLMILTIQRMTMDYNENGVYFDGEVTYDTDALLVYKVISILLLIITLGTALIWKANKIGTKNN